MSYPSMPEYIPNPIEWLRQTKNVVNGCLQGKTNNYGTVTLTANAASTTVTLAANRLSIYTVILLMPTTANAAAALTTTYIPTATIDTAAGTFVIQHSNNAQADKTFRYVLIG